MPPIDNNPYNLVFPEQNQLYVGWTNPGEWTRYTVNVTIGGTYQLGIMYKSNKSGKISVSVNDEDVTGLISIPSTFVADDPIAWRQWHHWNYLSNMASIRIKKGLHTITLHTVENGQMNYDYIDFEKIK